MIRRISILLLAFPLLAAGCLGGDDSTPTPAPPAPTTPAPTTDTSTAEPSKTPAATLTPRPRTPTPTETPVATETPRVIETPDPGDLAMKVLNYSTPIVPGQLAFITLISEDGATCTARLTYSNDEAAGPTRLRPKQISPVGQVDWTWKVGKSDPQTIDVAATCKKGGKQGLRTFTIVLEAASAQ